MCYRVCVELMIADVWLVTIRLRVIGLKGLVSVNIVVVMKLTLLSVSLTE